MMERGEAIRVLHVDDDPDIADLAAIYLEREDERITVETATSAREGLDRLDDQRFDCIVSDYDMPRQSGIDFLRTVRASYPELPFILFTGKGSEEIASDAIRAGATDYLQKSSGTDQYELLANRICNAARQFQSERAKQLLLELAENTDQILFSATSNWDDILFVNSAYEAVWGRSIADLYDDPIDFLRGVHPDDRGRVQDVLKTVSEGSPVDIEFRVNADVEYRRWVRAHVDPITDESGAVIRVAGFAAEITEERQRRERRKHQRDTLLELSTDDAVTTGDFDEAVRRITEAAADVLEVPRVNVWLRDDDNGEDILTCVDYYDRRTGDHSRGMELVRDEYPAYFEALETHHAIGAEDTREDPRTAELTADYLDVHDVGALLDGTLRLEGEVIGMVCHEHVGGTREWTDDEIDFASDIADIVHRAIRNQKRQERKEELELKTRAMDEAPVGITITDPTQEDNPLVTVNEQFERLTGYPEREIIGRNCRFLQGEKTSSESVATIREAIDAREPVSVTLKNYRKDGTEFWNRISIAPIRNEGGEITNYVGFQRDVTEQKE